MVAACGTEHFGLQVVGLVSYVSGLRDVARLDSIASSWLLFHTFHNDARSNSHQVHYIEFYYR
jgi:hypothetical protein